jgi:hypothetical protein
MEKQEYYVYEWFRPDTNECFYVGKGRGKRAWSYRTRNRIFRKVIGELVAKKLKPEVRIYKANLTENEALKLELERMAFWCRVFVSLTNIYQRHRWKAKVSRIKSKHFARRMNSSKLPITIRCKRCNQLFYNRNIGQIFCSLHCEARSPRSSPLPSFPEMPF